MINFIDEHGKQHSAIAECKKTKGVNGEKSLSGTIYTNEEILHGIGRGWRLQFEDENYCLTYVNPIDEGTRIVVDFDAVHEFFFDMKKSSVHTVLNGSHTAENYLKHIFTNSGYEYRLEAIVPAFEKENFGLENRLSLFKDFISSTGLEFSINGRVVRILETIGTDLSTIVKKGFNLNELRIEKDIGSFITYLKGYGAYKDSEDPSKGRLEVEYISPLAAIYGKLEGDPIVDERYTVASNFIERLKKEVENSYGISVDIGMEDLNQAGYQYDQPHEGDYIMAINKDLGLQQKIRILSYTTIYDTEGKIVKHDISCGRLNLIDQSRSSDSLWKNQIEKSINQANTTANFALISADGKAMAYYGSNIPTGSKFRKGDIWYKEVGEEKILYMFNGSEWSPLVDKSEIKNINEEFERQKNELKATKQTIETIHSQVRQAVDDAEFTKDNLQRVERRSLDALNQANLIFEQEQQILGDLSNVQEQTVTIKRITDELKGQLEQKVSQVSHDQLREQVQRQSVLIQQTSESLLIKADQSTVDRIDQRVAVQSANYEYLSSGMSSLITKTDGMKTEILELNSTAQRIQNSLSEQVNGITSKLTQTEQNLNGIQTTVYHQLQSIQSQQTQLANQYTSVIEIIGTTESWDFSEGLWEAGSINDQGQLINQSESIRTKNYIPVQQYDNLRTVTLEGKQIASTFYLYDENKRFIEKQANYINTIIFGRAAFIKVVLNNLPHAVLTDYAVIKSSTAQKPVRSIQSQLLQLSDRFNFTIQKGEIIAQINHELGKTLIQNNKIILDAENVELTGNAFIPAAFIKDLRVDAATIYGTLNAASVRVINVDASNLTSGYINSNRIQSRSITADKLSVDAIQVGFNSYSNVIKLNPSYLEFYNSNLLAGRLSSEGMEFWHYKTKIGFLGESYKVGQEYARGISMHLENTGDYITFGFKKTANASSFAPMLTLDPKGYFTGRKGIHFNEDVHLTRVRPGYEDADYLRFGVVGYNGSKYSALIYDNAQTGFMFSYRELYVLIDSSVYRFSDVINFVNRLKGKGTVYLPKEIYSDGTIKTYTTVTL
ncbi:phage tail protein [Enterococcus casseliflavus]|uniref:phage tail protein n=1 Tax=Enterococcus casseliflavus TaxID=37734 RepID=UPI002DC01BEE|nr:phage tail protein [Enterococcus casseliflavus]MEB8416306.1 phage tail protein [Enterococcus casseliflavus]